MPEKSIENVPSHPQSRRGGRARSSIHLSKFGFIPSCSPARVIAILLTPFLIAAGGLEVPCGMGLIHIAVQAGGIASA